MEIYQEDRKVLVIGVQISLIIHLLVYIILKFLPAVPVDHHIYQQPVEITIEDTEEKKLKNVQIAKPPTFENKKQEVSTTKGLYEMPEKVEKVAKQQEDNVKKNEKQLLTLDDNNLALLNKINSSASQPKKEEVLTESFVGEPLSKFDKNVEGDAFSRRVVYKPPPIKVEAEVPQPSVKVKIFISPSGDVAKVQLLTLTSDHTLNREIVNYLLRWKFNRIEENIVQYAVLTVYFTR